MRHDRRTENLNEWDKVVLVVQRPRSVVGQCTFGDSLSARREVKWHGLCCLQHRNATYFSFSRKSVQGSGIRAYKNAGRAQALVSRARRGCFMVDSFACFVVGIIFPLKSVIPGTMERLKRKIWTQFYVWDFVQYPHTEQYPPSYFENSYILTHGSFPAISICQQTNNIS